MKAQMLSFATLDVETAAGCFFTLPARKGGDGKPIQGPSIRMAEIALSTYQNIRAGARKMADDGKTVTVQGVCHDLQNNVCVSVEVQRRVTTKEGRRYSDDMVNLTCNAAYSIALRNAVFRVVPLALVKPIYEAAKKVAVGDAKTLATRRADALAHFTKMGVDRARVFGAIGVKALEDVTLEHLETLIGYANSIKDGDATIDETFPEPKEEATPGPKFTPLPKDDQVPGAEVPPAHPLMTPENMRHQSTPDATPDAKPAQGEQTPIQRDVKLLRMLLKQSGFTEGHILNLWRDNGLDESLASIDEVAEINPAFIRFAVEPWKNTLEGLKLAAQGGAK
ncbi:MAG: hypothetical protein EBY09_17520 [Verrucomicrobia bacterium]|nr:hypothetical protein [Verrucomicrobiota bacterium]